MPGMQLQQGWQGDKASLPPGGRVEGCCQGGGGPLFCLILPRGLSPGRRGAGWLTSSGQFRSAVGTCSSAGERRGTNGLGVRGRRGGSGSASAAPPTTRQEPRRLFPATRTQAPGTPPWQLSHWARRTGFQPARTGEGEENSLSCFGGLVASPWAQTPGLLFSEAGISCQSLPLMSPLTDEETEVTAQLCCSAPAEVLTSAGSGTPGQ